MTTTNPRSTTTEAADDSTPTTVDDEVLALGSESAPPPGGGSTAPVGAVGPSGDEGRSSPGNGGPFGLALHHWVLVIVAPALAVLGIWLVDQFGIRGKRSRHLFLESARGRRR